MTNTTNTPIDPLALTDEIENGPLNLRWAEREPSSLTMPKYNSERVKAVEDAGGLLRVLRNGDYEPTIVIDARRIANDLIKSLYLDLSEAKDAYLRRHHDAIDLLQQVTALKAEREEMVKALGEILYLAGRDGPRDDIEALNQIEAIAHTALPKEQA